MWVFIVGHEDYQVNAQGQVRRVSSGRVLKTHGRYPTVKLHGKTCAVHQLVWSAFKGPVPQGLEINHKDLDKTNPRLDNLELMTRQQNAQHAVANGVRYDHRGRAILTEDDVRFIREKYVPYKISRGKLAQMFGVTVECIKGVLYEKTWKEVN